MGGSVEQRSRRWTEVDRGGLTASLLEQDFLFFLLFAGDLVTPDPTAGRPNPLETL